MAFVVGPKIKILIKIHIAGWKIPVHILRKIKMELTFPIKGKHVGFPASKQPQGTSRDMNNVRPYWGGKLIGGQRPGLDKKFVQQIGGASAPVIWLGSVTVVVG